MKTIDCRQYAGSVRRAVQRVGLNDKLAVFERNPGLCIGGVGGRTYP